MERAKLGFLILSLPVAAMMFPYSSANAGLRINNAALQKEQTQQTMARAAAAQVNTAPQPARVITNDDGEVQTISTVDMDACNMIHPRGKFDWIKPTSGRLAGGPATCVAVVDLSVQKTDGTSVKLATTYLAAGDSMKCNIDDFNIDDASMGRLTAEGKNFEYPSDNPPTLDDVKKVMAQEQKQNSGLKILGAALVGGIGGNLLGTGEAGSDSPFGFGADKLKATAIGAAGAAAVMTASTQINDYKAGSVILSTGINSAAGAVVGNLSATGDDVIKITTCKIKEHPGDKESKETKCIYGKLDLTTGKKDGDTSSTKYKSDDKQKYIYDITNSKAYQCNVSTEQGHDKQLTDCRVVQVSTNTIEWQLLEITCGSSNKDPITCLKEVGDSKRTACYKDKGDNGKYKEYTTNTTDCTINANVFFEIKEVERAGKNIVAMIESDGISDKMFGNKKEDWEKLKDKLRNKNIYNTRGQVICADGSVADDTKCGTACPTDPDKTCTKIDFASLDNFKPANQSADDSDGVDFGNKARMKSTMIGAAGGAGLGALAGASGAEQEIQQRYVMEVDNYNNYLRTIWCSAGEWPLASYNSTFLIPEMKRSE